MTLFAVMSIVPQLSPSPKEEHNILIGWLLRIGSAIRVTIKDGITNIGDLAFYSDDEHVGIVAGWDEEGNILIVHCASGYNNVVITGKEGFISVAQPDIFMTV